MLLNTKFFPLIGFVSFYYFYFILYDMITNENFFFVERNCYLWRHVPSNCKKKCDMCKHWHRMCYYNKNRWPPTNVLLNTKFFPRVAFVSFYYFYFFLCYVITNEIFFLWNEICYYLKILFIDWLSYYQYVLFYYFFFFLQHSFN